jgi:hypothetical protein
LSWAETVKTSKKSDNIKVIFLHGYIYGVKVKINFKHQAKTGTLVKKTDITDN